MNTAHAVFRIAKAEEEPVRGGVPSGPKVMRGFFTFVYSGDIQGEGTLSEIKTFANGDEATMYGLQRVTGSVGDASGSFVFQHMGKVKDGVVTSKWTVLPGSGTGRLEKLRGEVNFSSAHAEEFPITFTYYFE